MLVSLGNFTRDPTSLAHLVQHPNIEIGIYIVPGFTLEN